jgi:hypothetical protein
MTTAARSPLKIAGWQQQAYMSQPGFCGTRTVRIYEEDV